MFKKVVPNKLITVKIFQFPHCDQRILHAPGECEVCDGHGQWQALRVAWGIAFTGYEPEGKELPCPADHARGDNHKLRGGNTAKLKHTHTHSIEWISMTNCPACIAERNETK